MKKNYLLVAAFLFIIIMLSACSGTPKSSEKSTEDKENASTNISKDNNQNTASDPTRIDFNSNTTNSDSSSSSDTSLSSSVNGVRPEVKEAIDSYEEFFDEYIEIMNKMEEEPSNMEILAKYTEYMSKYTETMQKFEELKDSDFNEAEALYYTEVSLRVEQKLQEAMKQE